MVVLLILSKIDYTGKMVVVLILSKIDYTGYRIVTNAAISYKTFQQIRLLY